MLLNSLVLCMALTTQASLLKPPPITLDIFYLHSRMPAPQFNFIFLEAMILCHFRCWTKASQCCFLQQAREQYGVCFWHDFNRTRWYMIGTGMQAIVRKEVVGGLNKGPTESDRSEYQSQGILLGCCYQTRQSRHCRMEVNQPYRLVIIKTANVSFRSVGPS